MNYVYRTIRSYGEDLYMLGGILYNSPDECSILSVKFLAKVPEQSEEEMSIRRQTLLDAVKIVKNPSYKENY